MEIRRRNNLVPGDDPGNNEAKHNHERNIENDGRFQWVMLREIKLGREHAPVGVSETNGTEHPKYTPAQNHSSLTCSSMADF